MMQESASDLTLRSSCTRISWVRRGCAPMRTGTRRASASMSRCGRAVFLSSRRMIQHEPWPLRELTGCRVRMSRSGSSPAERVRVLYPPTTASQGWSSAVHEHTTTCRKGSAGPAGRSPYACSSQTSLGSRHWAAV